MKIIRFYLRKECFRLWYVDQYLEFKENLITSELYNMHLTLELDDAQIFDSFSRLRR